MDHRLGPFLLTSLMSIRFSSSVHGRLERVFLKDGIGELLFLLLPIFFFPLDVVSALFVVFFFAFFFFFFFFFFGVAFVSDREFSGQSTSSKGRILSTVPQESVDESSEKMSPSLTSILIAPSSNRL